MQESKNKKEDLASKIAKSCKAEKDMKLFLYMVNHHKESTINKAYEDTMKVPDDKIKKTRSALFFFLVKKYDNHEEKEKN